MAGVNATVRSGDLGQLNNFLRLRERAGQVNQARRQPDRAVLHRLLDVAFHLRQLGLRRRAEKGAAHCLASHGIVADERADVGGDVCCLELLEILAEVQPRAAAVSQHERRHAHAEEVLGKRLVFDALRVRVRVHEAGRDYHPFHIHRALRRAGHAADSGNAPALHRHVGEDGGIPRAVRDAAAAQNEVVVLG